MSPIQPVPAEGGVSRSIGPWSAAALVAGNMIGAGVFTTSGFALADLGRPAPVLLAWVLGGLISLCGALSYGALARAYPESGGEYALLTRAWHPLAGFLAGWVSLLAGFTAPIAAAALGLQAYLAESLAFAGRPEWIGSAAIAMAGLQHALRLREGLWVQNLAVGLKVAAIAAFVALGAGLLPGREGPAPASAAGVGLVPFATTLVWISFAYSGWNAAVYVAGELREPVRNLTRVLVGATAGVGLLYVGLNAVFLYAAPAEALAGRAEVGAVAAEALGGPRLRAALSALVALALYTSISAMVMAGPRVVQRMAEDGFLPRALAVRREVPRAAVGAQVALALAVLWLSDLAELLGYLGFTLGLCAAATVWALLRVRRRRGAAAVPVPGHPWVQLAFLVPTVGASLFLAVGHPGQALAGLATVLVGLPVYAWTRRHPGPPEGSIG